jgi:hypothetical protein
MLPSAVSYQTRSGTPAEVFGDHGMSTALGGSDGDMWLEHYNLSLVVRPVRCGCAHCFSCLVQVVVYGEHCIEPGHLQRSPYDLCPSHEDEIAAFDTRALLSFHHDGERR